jgi:hypothetical protein
MKFHIMPEKHQSKGLCWKYAIACVLGVNPKQVPDFMRDSIDDGMAATRKWLKKKYNKGMVYVPYNCFLETNTSRDNPPGGPDGYSIMILETVEEGITHAVVAKDGKFIHDPNDFPGREKEFKHPVGFCIFYNL